MRHPRRDAIHGSTSLAPIAMVALVITSCVEAREDRTVDPVPACESCSLVEVSRVVLGSTGDSVSLAALPRVTVTERGTFYALSDALPLPGVLTYGEAGEFRGITGRRGNGPGEFERSWRLELEGR